MPELLIELFSEEIPARMQGNAARDLERMAKERLTTAGFGDVRLRTYAGPRRLTLVADDLPAAQADRTEEVKGPRVGAPPQAMDGFLKKVGLAQDALIERDGVYYAELSTKGRPTAHIIAEMVEHIVRTFPWPKSMRWGTSTLRWVRPLKRIVCLFDGAVVPVEIEGIKSGDVTEGHRFMGSGQPFKVSDFASYQTALTEHFVVLEAAERKRRILDGAKAACAARGFELVDDEGLLDEVSGLAEWPVPILGDMDAKFLDLPPEVIRTSMRTHQKYFAVRDPKTGRLAPHFLVVANIEAADGGKVVAAGNAKVLSARLSDARFFWDEDNKPGNFEAWLDKLNGVTFHAKLGTMAERVERIIVAALELGPVTGVGADQTEMLERAAHWAKADLTSNMVGEFPELQGRMGAYYAQRRHAGLPAIDAIANHYLPQGPSDHVPTAPMAAAVALADKLDSLVSFFSVDEKPTGSRDPLALRRAALGIVRILREGPHRVSLTRYIHVIHGKLASQRTSARLGEDRWRKHLAARELNLESYDTEPVDVTVREGAEYFDELVGDTSAVLSFLADRLKVALRDEGKRHDLVDAVFALGDDDLVRIVARVEALSTFLTTDDGANLLAGYKRAANILRAEEKKGPLPTGAAAALSGASAEEGALIAALAQAAPKVDTALAAEDFAAAMAALASLRGPVDAFFDKVLVNSDVPDERANRLKLLGQVKDLMGRVADFSQISG
jgi:glycyl-tRNA synthetase beta chain